MILLQVWVVVACIEGLDPLPVGELGLRTRRPVGHAAPACHDPAAAAILSEDAGQKMRTSVRNFISPAIVNQRLHMRFWTFLFLLHRERM